MNPPSPNRRIFLGAASASLAGLATRAADANSALSVGLVGPGGRARGLMNNFFAVNKECNAELTAICDIWSVKRDMAVASVKKTSGKEPRAFKRIEEMLAWDGLDAVVVATPDHSHAKLLMNCLQAGKHVYCEKPLANVVEEANEVIDLYRKVPNKAVTLGTQRRSHPQFLAAADLMKTDPLGPLVRIDIAQNYYSPNRWRRPADVLLLKEADTDWKTWLMGRPDRKFDPHLYLEFRLFREFSSGIIDQWYSHLIDACHMLTGATFPRSVVANGGVYVWKDGRDTADTLTIAADYPQGFLVNYSANLANGQGSHCQIAGRQGVLEFEDSWKLLLGNGAKGSKIDEKPIAPKEGLKGTMDHIHMRDWLQCARAGKKETNCTPEHGYQHSIACIMADRALNTGKRQVFDEKSRMIREG